MQLALYPVSSAHINTPSTFTLFIAVSHRLLALLRAVLRNPASAAPGKQLASHPVSSAHTNTASNIHSVYHYSSLPWSGIVSPVKSDPSSQRDNGQQQQQRQYNGQVEMADSGQYRWKRPTAASTGGKGRQRPVTFEGHGLSLDLHAVRDVRSHLETGRHVLQPLRRVQAREPRGVKAVELFRRI